MGARGKLQVPAHLRAVTDDDSAGSAAETAPREAPPKPDSIAKDAGLSALWDQIVPELDRCGFLTKADGPVLELALRHFKMAVLAAEAVGDEPSVEASRNAGVKKNPAEAVFRAQSDMFLRYSDKLGMNWMARARTPAAKVRDDGESNPFASTGS